MSDLQTFEGGGSACLALVPLVMSTTIGIGKGTAGGVLGPELPGKLGLNDSATHRDRWNFEGGASSGLGGGGS